MSTAIEKKMMDAPEDKFNIVYFVFYFLGVGTLLPWNFFISVPAYWNYKYRTMDFSQPEGVVSVSDGAGANETVSSVNDLQVQWNSNLAIASMVPNVTFLLLNAVFGHRFKTQPRLIISLTLVILLFIFTCIMTKVDTDHWQAQFQTVTLISVALINTNAAIFQGGLLGISGKFPPRYIGGVFSGQALGGIFASATNVIMIALGAGPTDAACFCFAIACLFLGVSMAVYLYVTRSDFFKYYLGEENMDLKVPVNAAEDGKLMENKESAPPSTSPPPIPTKVNPLLILKNIWVYALSVFLIFVVTLGCFPAITVLVKSTGTGKWSQDYFIPVICFLGFNVGDYVGRMLSEKIQFPKPGARGGIIVLGLTLLRFAFVPLFLFCNAIPDARSTSSVLFESDTVYIILMALFSLSNGYLSSICMMSGPQLCLKPEEQSTAASLMVACLGFGLGGGALISKAFVLLL